jgi:minor extracellular serine protease Vpr
MDRPHLAVPRIARIAAVFSIGLLTTSVALAAPFADPGDENPAAAPFSHLNVKATGLVGTFQPASLAGDRKTAVIVKVSGDSVGDLRAAAKKQGRGDLTDSERAAIRSQLKAKQDQLASAIAALGGTATEQYQDAYNGLAAQVPMSALPALASLPNVEAVFPSRTVSLDNVAGVQYIGGNSAWADLGLTGAGVKVAVIDTGIDYYHANFGGTDGANKFAADNGLTISASTFPTAKVVGGFDFVGDAYDANSSDPAVNTPHPDPDPLDCNGHGSHTAGSAAGFGVLSSGATYAGPYDGTTYSNSFTVGPGVAPQAFIYAYRVFGCDGSATDAVIVAALNRAMTDNVDVVNMSLGSVFGRADAPDSVASNTLADNGIVVVASAGNSGPSAYVTGSPAAASRALSVAAIDASSPTFPGATITLSTGQTITAQLSNGPFQGDSGASLPSAPLAVKVLKDTSGNVSLGCTASDFAGSTGKLVVVLRGVCARVHKAILGQQAGAAAVAMIDTSTGFPPFEGDITSDPDTGQQFHVTIAFFGVKGLLGSTPASDGDKLAAADGGSANTIVATTVPNPSYQRAAGFTSGGPRNVDSGMKPEVIAPGVSVKSTAAGTGDQGTRMSGTSMASPMTAGLAALVTQAHPTWTTEAIKAAIVNTADASTAKILGYNPRTSGAGVVQARRAVDSVAYVTTSADGSDTLSFGYQAFGAAGAPTLPITIHNTSASAITYNLAFSVVGSLGSVGSVSPASLTVAAGSTATAMATLTLSAAAVAGLPGAEASNFGALQTARGAVVATPTTSGTGIYALRVPYILAPRGLSNITAGARSAYTRTGGTSTATVPLSNTGIHGGTADVYAWGIHDANDITGGEDSMDVRDVGVQVQPKSFLCGTDTTGVCAATDDRSIVFAINTYGQASNPAISEFDILIDLQADGKPDFFVVGVDFGAVTTGTFDGRFTSFIFDKNSNLIDLWVADAPMNGSTILLPTLASEIGLLDPAASSTRFRYSVNAFSIVPGVLVDTTAASSFRSDEPPVSTGQQIPLAPGANATLTVSVDRGKLAGTPQLGWLIVGLDDANGAAQADEIAIGTP